MKKVLFAATAAAAMIAAAPALAEPGAGYVGAYWTNLDADGGSDVDGWGIDGAIAMNSGGPVGVILDGSYTMYEDTSTDIGVVTAHLVRRGDSWTFGGFAGLADSGDTTVWIAGGEAAKRMEMVTIAGALGYADSPDLTGAEGWGANGELRFFATDNLRFDVGAEYWDLDVSGVTNFGVGAEWKMDSHPISLYASWDQTDIEDIDFEFTTLTVGLRFAFGGSLRDRDATGATFGPSGGFAGARVLAGL